MNEVELTAIELRKSVNAMADFFEDFYPLHRDTALQAKLRGHLSEAFAELVGTALRTAKEAVE